MTKIIEVIVTPNGQSTVTTKGFVGGECRQTSAFLETALGAKTGEQFTAEYYQPVVEQQPLRQGGGV